jgi:hypothetical protein
MIPSTPAPPTVSVRSSATAQRLAPAAPNAKPQQALHAVERIHLVAVPDNLGINRQIE